jgi:DeoR family transcriptional regulator of aga operon/DeoR family myo-inositol catabolism operon transcriptional repressor
MLVAERRKRIKALLMQDGSVKVADLVTMFEVSEETVRRDLHELERAGIALKNYGGAILADEVDVAPTPAPSVQQRKVHLAVEKDAIGRCAAAMVGTEQVVMLDAGSTTSCVARYLADSEQVTVVTNSITVADSLSQNQHASVFVLGGKLHPNFMSLIAPYPEEEIRKFSADIVFLGASGITLDKGFTSVDVYEAQVKRAMIEVARKVVVVADHSKFEKRGLVSFSDFANVDVLITSKMADSEIVKQIEAMGVEVLICELS